MKIQYNEDGTPFVMWGEIKIQLEKMPISDEICKRKAETELRETPENVEKGLRELRTLLKGESS